MLQSFKTTYGEGQSGCLLNKDCCLENSLHVKFLENNHKLCYVFFFFLTEPTQTLW